MKYEEALSSWRSLRLALRGATEDEAAELLRIEKENSNRPTFVARIYGRYNTLRNERERRQFTGAMP